VPTAAGGIDILDPQKKLSAGMVGGMKGEESGECMAKVKLAVRAGRKAVGGAGHEGINRRSAMCMAIVAA
jgi:hypothetical protein